MPLPMVHLSTARELVKVIPSINIAEFYLGSISPDAVHMREGSSREDKHISHLRNEGKKDRDKWTSSVIEYIRKCNDETESSDQYSFIMGYGVHILTDIIWNDTLYSKFRDRYEADSEPIQDVKWAYYNDTDKLDFELFKVCEWRKEVWKLLDYAGGNSIDGILSVSDIDSWKYRTLHWYDSGESQHQNPIRYIKLDELIEFSKTTAVEIKELLLQNGLLIEKA